MIITTIMLKTPERVFLYKYLYRILGKSDTPAIALGFYLEDTGIRGSNLKKLKFVSQQQFKLGELSTVLFKARLIPKTEHLIIKQATQYNAGINQTLLKLANNLERGRVIKRKINTLLIYPFILSIELLMILSVAIFWLTPQMNFFFSRLSINTPKLLRVFYFLNDWLRVNFVKSYWPWFMVLILLGWMLYQFSCYPKIKIKLDYIVLNMPLVGRLYRLIALQQIFSYINLLTDDTRQKRFNRELRSAAKMTTNILYQKKLSELAQHLESSKKIKIFWQKQKNRRYFPASVRRLLILGDKFGDYGPEIRTINQVLGEELELELKHFIAILEPIMIISIATIVMLFALSLQNALAQMQNAVAL